MWKFPSTEFKSHGFVSKNFVKSTILPKLNHTQFHEKNLFISVEVLCGTFANFVGLITLVIAFSSPYWLKSWEATQSPFQNMGLWEFCFYKFRHPDYQFDHLFHGCHSLYGDEFRLIREKLLPGNFRAIFWKFF